MVFFTDWRELPFIFENQVLSARLVTYERKGEAKFILPKPTPIEELENQR
jgi:hypothetical protein